MTLPRDAMGDTVSSQDGRPEPPTLDDLQRAHDWRTEERADGRFIVDICGQCGLERAASRAGKPPGCEVREIPARLVARAKRYERLPETGGGHEGSMLGVLSGSAETDG